MRSIEGGLEGPFGGMLIDKYGERKITIISTIIACAGLIALLYVRELWQFIVVWGFIVSLGFNLGLYDTVNSAVSKWFVKKRGRALSLVTLGGGLGGPVIVPMMAWFIINYGWRTALKFVAGSTYQYYRIKTPTLVPGVWNMRATGGSIVTDPLGRQVIATESGEPYVARVTGQANLTMRFFLDRDIYLTTEPIKLIATLSDAQPITGAAVNVTVRPPSMADVLLRSTEKIEINGDPMPDPALAADIEAANAQSSTSITLFDDGSHGDGAAGDGVYANSFSGTFAAGTYVFSAAASGTSNTGEVFTRQSELSTYITENPHPNIYNVYLPLLTRKLTLVSGFNSQFNGSAQGWEPHYGPWYVDSSYYYTYGLPGSVSSASYSANYADFFYEAKMWRYGCDSCANRIYLRGTVHPMTGYNWYEYYIFQYSRNGYFSVWKRVGGGIYQVYPWTYSSAINAGSAWNTLGVAAWGPNLYYYINDTLVWAGSDSSLSFGRVGLGMYRDPDSSGNGFWVDWATLSPLIAGDLDAISADALSAEQQALGDAALQQTGGDENLDPSAGP